MRIPKPRSALAELHDRLYLSGAWRPGEDMVGSKYFFSLLPKNDPPGNILLLFGVEPILDLVAPQNYPKEISIIVVGWSAVS